MTDRRIVVLGAGPIGLEAALHAADAGYDVRLFEGGRVGEHLRRWGHVRLFSPWRLNHSARGARLLAANGHPLPGDEDFLTGAEHVAAYLEPLAASPPLAGRIVEGARVVEIGRRGIGKSDLVGGPRDAYPFRLLVDVDGDERIVEADVVLDCTGTYGNPNWMGNGNVPALGERRLRQRIRYHLDDVAGAACERYAGKRVLLVGAGHSAATALDALIGLDGTRVVWVTRGHSEPFRIIEDDPLPERSRLGRLANRLARGEHPQVERRAGCSVEQVSDLGTGFAVQLDRDGASETIEVDRILAHVGYRPDRRLYRELQVHECYATLGPMKLAATLLQGSADCLSQPPAGAETLTHPEPGFFILGAKSYGRNSNFLIQLGLQQIVEVFTLIGD